jgi:phosphoribosyl-ATP pyrophosphohydrolase
MILLKINNNDLEKFGGLKKLIDEVVYPRNWDLFITLILELDGDYILKMIETGILRKAGERIDIWINSKDQTLRKELLKNRVKRVKFVLKKDDIILELDSTKNFLNIDKCIIEMLDFEKVHGLIPTVVQDEDGIVLMLAYSSKESLERAISNRKGIYYSRTRNEIWEKGKESGNYQILERIYYDCDRDALLFKVKQKNFACHTGSYSCFQNSKFSLRTLFKILEERNNNSSIETSYTKRLLENNNLLISKINEESKEVINFTNKTNLIWEIADLTYFLLVLMVREEISPNDIINELWSRNV